MLRDVDNTLYRVQARDGRRFLLRLHALHRHSPAELHGELAWLAALRRDTALRVPEPVATQDGAFFVDVALAGVPEPRRCVLLHWLPGQVRSRTMQPQHIERVGAFMAHLHTHAEHYQPPAPTPRRAWDWARLFDHQSPLWHKGPAIFSREEMAVQHATADRIAAALQGLGTAPHVYGMIHSDLNFSNVLFDHGQVGAIDFEECGPGYYLFDMAVTIFEFDDVPDQRTALRAAFLAGYARERTLPTQFEQHIATFLAMRHVDLITWVLGWNDPLGNPRVAPFFQRHLAALQQLLGD